MASLERMPTEIQRLIMQHLEPKDKFSMGEASWPMKRVNDLQIESSTNFQIKPHKKLLAIVITETDCKTATKQALRHYPEIHLIIARHFVEDDRANPPILDLLTWVNDVTEGGKMEFTSIGLVGAIGTCGSFFGQLLKFGQMLTIDTEQSDDDMHHIVSHALIGNGDQRPREIIYNAGVELEWFSIISRCLPPYIHIKVRYDLSTIETTVKADEEEKMKINIKCLKEEDMPHYFACLKIGLRNNLSSGDETVGRLLSLPSELLIASTKAFR